MEQIKRNSREFRDIQKLVEDYREKSSRKKLILLYAVKPSEDLSSRKSLNNDKTHSAFYDLTYDSLVEYLNNEKKKLFREGNKPLYYFKNSASAKFIEMPFEFKGKLKEYLFPLKVHR